MTEFFLVNQRGRCAAGSGRVSHRPRKSTPNIIPSHEFAAIRARVCFGIGMREPRLSRKLLIASVGVATINYVAACVHEPETTGNLVAPPLSSAGAQGSTEGSVPVAGGVGGAVGVGSGAGSNGEVTVPPTSGNLVAPPPSSTAPLPSSTPPTSGNLMPPPKPLPTGGVKPPIKAH